MYGKPLMRLGLCPTNNSFFRIKAAIMLPIRIGLGRKRRKNNRTHQFSSGANFDWAIKLYYFDFDLRNILLRYISRIEVNFRTSVFANYINTVRKLRNNCAHEKVLFDMTLPQAIGDGPCGNLDNRRTMLFGAYKVFKYVSIQYRPSFL